MVSRSDTPIYFNRNRAINFRVAISNNRFLKLENDCVTFRYRATDTGAEKRCTLSAEEYIYRFLQHVLPKGFVKIRYYGFFAATRRARLASVRQHLGTLTSPTPSAQSPSQTDPTPALPQRLCPHCGQPMLVQQTLAPLLCRFP